MVLLWPFWNHYLFVRNWRTYKKISCASRMYSSFLALFGSFIFRNVLFKWLFSVNFLSFVWLNAHICEDGFITPVFSADPEPGAHLFSSKKHLEQISLYIQTVRDDDVVSFWCSSGLWCPTDPELQSICILALWTTNILLSKSLAGSLVSFPLYVL